MTLYSRFLSSFVLQRIHIVQITRKEVAQLHSASVNGLKHALKTQKQEEHCQKELGKYPVESFRYKYPEFLPDPNPLYRNALREKLERLDMLARRNVINIPEFYVGSILSITYSEKHSPDQVNKFVGICIKREGCGLRSSVLLRNAINGEGVEVLYNLYDPTIRSIECLKLEKRLDDELLYLRDAPIEYSTIPFDMEPQMLSEDSSVLLNEIKVPLKPPPWFCKWEQKGMKGIKDLVVNEKRTKKAQANAKPWEKYDIMKLYRSTIPEEEQNEIYTELNTEISVQKSRHHKVKRGLLHILKKTRKPSA